MLWTLARLTVVPSSSTGVKDRHRIDQPGPGRAPLDLQKPGLAHFIGPFKGIGIPGELGSSSKGRAIGNVHHRSAPVRRKGNHCLRSWPQTPPPQRAPYLLSPSGILPPGTLAFQPLHLRLPGIMELHAIRLYQRKCVRILHFSWL